MPLSEQEQRLLDEMERNLYQNDADFVARVSRRVRPSYTALVVGVLVGITGVVLLLVGVSTRLTVVGLIGFIVMFAGVLVAINGPHHVGTRTEQPATRQSKPSFMDRMNERWERRDGDR